MPLPLNALTTVEAVQEEGVSASVSVSRIERVIGYVSSWFESVTEREFAAVQVPSEAPERYEGSGGLRLYLRRRPIVEVESVILTSGGSDVLGTALTDYLRTADSDKEGYLYRQAGWPLSGGRFPDLTHDPRLHPQVEYILVAYTGGYMLPWVEPEYSETPLAPPLPGDLQYACIREVVRLLSRSPGLLEESTPGGWSQKFSSAEGFTAETLEVLDAYKPATRWLT